MSIRLKNVSKNYEQVTALDNVSLDFEEGKTTVLVGPSGCGKSTMIRIVIGLLKKNSGNIIINSGRKWDM